MKIVYDIRPIRKERVDEHLGWIKLVFDSSPVILDGTCNFCFKRITATGNISDMWAYGRGLINEDELRVNVTDISDASDLFYFSHCGLCAHAALSI